MQVQPHNLHLAPGFLVAIPNGTSWAVAEVISVSPECVAVMQDEALCSVGWDEAGPPF